MNARDKEIEYRKSIIEQIKNNQVLSNFLKEVLGVNSEKDVIDTILSNNSVPTRMPFPADVPVNTVVTDEVSPYSRLYNYLSGYYPTKAELKANFKTAVDHYDPNNHDASIAEITKCFFALAPSDEADAEKSLKEKKLSEKCELYLMSTPPDGQYISSNPHAICLYKEENKIFFLDENGEECELSNLPASVLQTLNDAEFNSPPPPEEELAAWKEVYQCRNEVTEEVTKAILGKGHDTLYEPVSEHFGKLYQDLITPMNDYVFDLEGRNPSLTGRKKEEDAIEVITNTSKFGNLPKETAKPSDYKTEINTILGSLRTERLGKPTDLEVIQRSKDPLVVKIAKAVGSVMLALTGVGLVPLGVLMYDSYKKTGSLNFLASIGGGQVKKAIKGVEKELDITPPRKSK